MDSAVASGDGLGPRPLAPDLNSHELERHTIVNRSGLIHALTEAAELEHGLMVQYLFAAFSIRMRPGNGLTVADVEMLRQWKAAILQVAREEMAHLGTVCNLLTAVGGAPHFRRPNFPLPRRYFPDDYQPFTLEPFSGATIDRFVAFEAPPPDSVMGITSLDPVLRYSAIGHFYWQIAEAFRTLDPPGGLFIGPPRDQDSDTWSASMTLHAVTDVATAIAAIEFIVVEGEGTDQVPEGYSHWRAFRTIQEDLRAVSEARPGFQPSHPVASNPLTRPHPHDDTVTRVDHPHTREVSELFNFVYGTVLLLLMQVYAFAGETAEQRTGIMATIRRLMSGVVRPLGEVLTELPVHPGTASMTAGPSFELYSDLRPPTQRSSAWTAVSERLHEAARKCGDLTLDAGPAARLGLVAEHLRLAARGVDDLGGQG